MTEEEFFKEYQAASNAMSAAGVAYDWAAHAVQQIHAKRFRNMIPGELREAEEKLSACREAYVAAQQRFEVAQRYQG